MRPRVLKRAAMMALRIGDAVNRQRNRRRQPAPQARRAETCVGIAAQIMSPTRNARRVSILRRLAANRRASPVRPKLGGLARWHLASIK